MKFDYGYNFIRITFKEDEMTDSALTVGADPMLAKYPIIAYCEDTGALYTGAYDDGTVTLAEYGSGSGGSGGTDIVYVPIDIDFSGDEPVVTCDIAFADVLSYMAAGKTVYLSYTSQFGTVFIYYPVNFSTTDNNAAWVKIDSSLFIEIIEAEESGWFRSQMKLAQVPQ